jgi:replicative DNA helicase
LVGFFGDFLAETRKTPAGGIDIIHIFIRKKGEWNMDEQLMNRQPPQSLEAEQSVLGSILIDSRCVADIIGILRPEDFFLDQNREIYETVYTMFNFSETIDPVTVLEKMRQLGVYHDNTRDYVQQLMEITPTAANAVRYANIVKDKAMLRGLADASSDISELVYDQVGTPAEILESAEKKIYALRKGDTGDSLEHVGVTLLKVFDTLTELSQSDSAFPGISTGLRELDKKINGLNKSELLLIAARTAMGKTALALNLALHVAKK